MTRTLTSATVITVRGLQKTYGHVEAVGGIDLTVLEGEVFAFLGPNGAGKTTTVEILEGYRTRTAGEVEVLGRDPTHPTRAWRSRIGLVLQTCHLPADLTVHELVDHYAAYYPHPRGIDETIVDVGLGAKRNARVGSLSGGQQRRLAEGARSGGSSGARRRAGGAWLQQTPPGCKCLLTRHQRKPAIAVAHLCRLPAAASD